jgi:hypothetical protein
MKKVFRRLLYLVLGILGAIAASLAMVAVVNTFDEDLSPEAKALSEFKVAGEPSKQNGYVDLLGFAAPPDEDVYGWGLKALEAFRAQEEPGFKRDDAWKRQALHGDPSISAAGRFWCMPETLSCLERAKDAVQASLLKQHVVFMRRHRTMREKPEFIGLYAPRRYESQYPPYRPVFYGQQLSLLGAAFKANAGNLGGALDELEKEVAFHRRMLAGSRDLLQTLIGLTALARDVLFLSELVRENAAALRPHQRRLSVMLKPLSPEERDFTRVLQKEYGEMVENALNHVWLAENKPEERITRFPVWLERIAYRPRATANAIAQKMPKDRAVIEGPSVEFVKAAAEYRARWEEAHRERIELEDFGIVNPAGKLLVKSRSLVLYAARRHDVEGLLALARLQLAASRGGAARQSIEAVLAGEEGKANPDPNTGERMRFDPVTGTIYFMPQGEGGWITEFKKRWNGRIALKL